MVEAERQRHRVTRIIAATRFPFLDQEESSWPHSYQTIVNDEQSRFGLKGRRAAGRPATRPSSTTSRAGSA